MSRDGDKPRSLERRLQLAHAALVSASTRLYGVMTHKALPPESELADEQRAELLKLHKAVESMCIWNARLLYKHRKHSDEVLKARYEKAST